jgi:hypothetical protein
MVQLVGSKLSATLAGRLEKACITSLVAMVGNRVVGGGPGDYRHEGEDDTEDEDLDVFIVLVKTNIIQKVQDTLDLWAKHLPLVKVHTLLGCLSALSVFLSNRVCIICMAILCWCAFERCCLAWAVGPMESLGWRDTRSRPDQ